MAWWPAGFGLLFVGLNQAGDTAGCCRSPRDNWPP